MKDWAGSVRTRNFGIKRHTDRRSLCDLLRITAPGILLAGAFGFYAWLQCGMVDLGYQEQSLNNREEILLAEQSHLIAEEQTLKRPERIDDIARNQLGMVRVQMKQMVAPAVENYESGEGSSLALAAPPTAVPKPSSAD